MSEAILVTGSGYMAQEYLKVLSALGHQAVIVGRGKAKVEALQAIYPQFEFHSGGIDLYLSTAQHIPSVCINTSSIPQLRPSTVSLLKAGVKKILLEKPGDLTKQGIEELYTMTKQYDATVCIAYNRRFYTSVIQLQKALAEDGGATGAHFEFAEWVHTIDPKLYDAEALDKWIMSNSSHVIDTAFYLLGSPKELHAIVLGQNEIEWHKSGSVFCGSGLSEKNIPFTYHSNWNAPGRWAIEIWTRNRRFYLKPMEKLAVQLKGSVSVGDFPIDDSLDREFKPGLFIQTQNFIEGSLDGFCTIEEQHVNMQKIYSKITGYPA